MTDPLGTGTFQGLCVPLFGESVIRQQNSSNAILTLMHSTANTGRLLMGLDQSASSNAENPLISSLLTDKAVFDIDADGGFRSISGTTVLVELNSSGLFVGSEVVVGPSGGVARRPHTDSVSFSSDGSTAQTLLSSNAGKTHIVAETSGAGYSSVVVSLPTSATASQGQWWDVFCSDTTAASVIDIAAIGANHSILAHHGSTNAVGTSVAITHGTSGPFWVRVLFASTAGTTNTFVVSNMLGWSGGSTNADYYTLLEGS
jgi:hypothetical protein